MKRILSLFLSLSCLLALCACGGAQQPDPGTGALTSPVYPSMHPQPNQADYATADGWDVSEEYYTALRAWREDLDSLRGHDADYAAGLTPWFAGSIRQFLSGAEGENRVCSPLNIAMALSMLAEVTDGESRQQLLDLLGVRDLDALRAQAAALWKVNYQDDGVTASILANSLWLDQDLRYETEALENLAKYYYAAGFSGQMGSPAYDALLQSWLNEQTGGLLEKQASGLHMAPETVLALASTVYFKSPWESSFYSGATGSGLFHSPGGEQTVDFMHRSDETAYYWGERFSAVGLALEDGRVFWLLLPDEGVTPEELLEDEEAMDFLLTPEKLAWEQQKYLIVHLSVPRFDVSSDLDLIEGLQRLGITDVFDPTVSDFSPLIRGTDPIAVTQARHAARVHIDEEGCEAAAYTVIMMEATAAAPPDDQVDFVLDRPFLFSITSPDGLPLFAGLVNRPAE